VQLVGAGAAVSLGKSYPGFGPIGPAIVTSDELADRTTEPICALDEELLQKGRTRDMVFLRIELIADCPRSVPLPVT